MELIDKSAVVAEIEKRIKTNKGCMLGLRNLDYYQGKVDALNDTISFLNTLEVKEVDLDKEIQQHINDCLDVKFPTTDIKMIEKDVEYTARKFFELGLKAQKGK